MLREHKLVILAREDRNMRKRKSVAQGAHAKLDQITCELPLL